MEISKVIKQRDDFAVKYDEFYKRTHPFFGKELNKILEALNPKENETIFDAGCGTGMFSEHIAKKCKFLFGVDYSKESVKIFESASSPTKLTNLKSEPKEAKFAATFPAPPGL